MMMMITSIYLFYRIGQNDSSSVHASIITTALSGDYLANSYILLENTYVVHISWYTYLYCVKVFVNELRTSNFKVKFTECLQICGIQGSSCNDLALDASKAMQNDHTLINSRATNFRRDDLGTFKVIGSLHLPVDRSFLLGPAVSIEFRS